MWDDVIALAAEFPNDNPALHSGVMWVCLDPVGAPVAVREAPEPRAEALPEELPPASEPEPLVVAEPVAVEPPDRRGAPREPEPEVVAELDEVAAKLAEVAARLESVARAEAGARPLPTMTDASPMMADAPPTMADAPPTMADAPEEGPEREPPRASGIVAVAAPDDGDDEPIVVEELEPIDAIAEEAAPPSAAPDDPFVQLCGIMADVARAEAGAAVADALPKLFLDGALDAALGGAALAALAEGGLADGAQPTAALTSTLAAWRAVLSGASDDLSACGGATLDEWAADVLARLLGSAAKASAIRRELRSRGVAAFGLLEAA